MIAAGARTNLLVWLRWAPLIGLLAALPCHAQYKVVGPDGKITYTDRAPTGNEGKVTSLGLRANSASTGGDPSLPLELRQSVARYPVTLYVTMGNCDPCESARQLLRQRGIPFAEKQVQTPEDSDALERISGGRDAPTLTVGTQMLRGFAPEVWGSYLDAAGYPRDSRLPASFQYTAPTPIVDRREASVAPRAPTPRASQPSAADTPAPSGPTAANPLNIKF